MPAPPNTPKQLTIDNGQLTVSVLSAAFEMEAVLPLTPYIILSKVKDLHSIETWEILHFVQDDFL